MGNVKGSDSIKKGPYVCVILPFVNAWDAAAVGGSIEYQCTLTVPYSSGTSRMCVFLVFV